MPTRRSRSGRCRWPWPTVARSNWSLPISSGTRSSTAAKASGPPSRSRRRPLDGYWEFSVADNSIGIGPEYYDRIFEMFRRLHTEEPCGGTGIGLTVVKRIVERNGGTVRVESIPGKGSTFFFTFPAA